MIFAALTVAFSVIGWALWVRRHTWRCRWELAGNLTIVLQAGALFLTAPQNSSVLGNWLHDVTGRWNVEDFSGHCLFIAAAAATVYHALSRMQDQSKFLPHAVSVVILAFAARLYLFVSSDGSRRYGQDYLAMHAGALTAAYWIVTCGTVIYLLAYASRLMLVLRTNPRHRRTANVYLCGAAIGTLTCIAKILDATTATQSMQLPTQIWMGCCIGVSGFAFGHGYSWRQRTRELQGV